MSAQSLSPAAPLLVRRARRGFAGRLLRRRGALLGLILFALLCAMALAAPWLAIADPLAVNPSQTLQPPGPGHPMGTDNLGRDVWSRLVYGGRISLTVGLAACAFGALVGTVLGVLAGYYGRWVDVGLTWFTEVLMAFPGVLLAMVVVVVLGSGMENVILAVGIALVPSFLRMARGAVLAVRAEPYVEAAEVIGVRPLRVMARHVLPNISRPLVALLTIGVGGAILEGAALSFLGLGAQPPSPEWGAMLNAAQSFLRVGWWMGLFPGLAIFLTVLAVNLIGDAVTDLYGT